MARPSIRLLIALTVVMAISGAAGAFAAGGRFKADTTDDPTCVVTADTTCEEPADDETTDEGDAKDEAVTPEEREAACGAAAGYTDETETEVPEDTEDPEQLTGLDRAIDRVYTNCLKNPDAPGLLNALEHLRLNAERKEAREAEHEARAAERAADKAAREAERLARAAERAAEKAERAAEKAERGAGGGNGHGGGNPHD